jgi:hypothetical protein
VRTKFLRNVGDTVQFYTVQIPKSGGNTNIHIIDAYTFYIKLFFFFCYGNRPLSYSAVFMVELLSFVKYCTTIALDSVVSLIPNRSV